MSDDFKMYKFNPAIPEPRVDAVRYAVTCLPENHREIKNFTLWVTYRGDDLWSISDGDYLCNPKVLGSNGQWDYETYPAKSEPGWLEHHRFRLDMAIHLAKATAKEMKTYNGYTVADALKEEDDGA